jgi:ribonuclease Z
MPTAYLLGSGAAISDPHRTTTMLAFDNGTSLIVVDCGGDVIQRLMQVGIPYQEMSRIEALILTHEHPDHIGGFALFMEKLWLAGRREPIHIYGPAPALEQARRQFEVYDTANWTGMPEKVWHEVALDENAPVLESDQWHILASPGIHSVPVIGLRVRDQATGRVVAYSCDTEPSQTIARLARNADLLFHEATGEGPSHSSVRQAAEIAAQAEPHRLVFVHIPPMAFLTDEEIEAVGDIFAGERGEELGKYEF